MFERIGKIVINSLISIGEVSLLFISTIKWMFKKPVDFKNIVNQMVHIGYNSMPVIFITSLFTGMVIALQTGLTLESTLKGMSQFIGGVVSVSMARELAPVLTSLIMAGRIGSSIAAEIGTMQVTEQIDALEVMAIDPYRFLSFPRILGTLISLPLLTVCSEFVAIFTGALYGHLFLDIPIEVFNYGHIRNFYTRDLFGGLLKSVLFALVIATSGCYFGFNVKGGAREVGLSTTYAVVTASILILVLDFIVALVVFG